jgi:hypothetical protein
MTGPLTLQGSQRREPTVGHQARLLRDSTLQLGGGRPSRARAGEHPRSGEPRLEVVGLASLGCPVTRRMDDHLAMMDVASQQVIRRGWTVFTETLFQVAGPPVAHPELAPLSSSSLASMSGRKTIGPEAMNQTAGQGHFARSLERRRSRPCSRRLAVSTSTSSICI